MPEFKTKEEYEEWKAERIKEVKENRREQPREFVEPDLKKPSEPVVIFCDPNTKQCPYCAETIKKEAIICRFCKRQIASAPHSSMTVKDGVRLGIGMFIVLPLIILALLIIWALR
jgi:hypothetical protein